jgi:hypothetical protein
MITFCDISNSDMDAVDPNMVKLFKLSQLIIEFLLHSQSCLLKDRQDDLDRCKVLIESKSDLERDLEKANRDVEDCKREIKSLKKNLFVYELMSKKPGNGKGEYYQCQYCPKAFSTLEYRIAHEKRRHPGLMSPKEFVSPPKLEPKEEKPSKELLKVVELIELMSKAQIHEQESKEEREAELKVEKKLEQEKLRFEKEFQQLTAKMNQKMEEEMIKLKQDREAFENLVNSQAKQISHVGNLEDDEEKEEKEQEEKHQKELQDLRREHQQDLDLVQQRVLQEMQILRESMRLDQSKYSQSLEDRLAHSAREIEYLKSKQVEKLQLISEAIQVEHLVSHNVSIPEIVIPFEKSSVMRDEPPLPLKTPSIDKLFSPASGASHHLLGWKQYLEVLKGKSIVQHPGNKFASCMYQHSQSEIEGKKELIKLEIDQFLSDYGLTPTTVSKGLQDVSIQSCFQQLSDMMQHGRNNSNKKMYYEEMRQYLDTLLDSAASQTTDFNTYQAEPTVNRKSSLRKSIMKTASSPKNVRISDQKHERIISDDESNEHRNRPVSTDEDRGSSTVVKSTAVHRGKKPSIKIPVELSSPTDKQTLETLDKLRQITPKTSTPSSTLMHTLSPYSQYFSGSPTSTSPLKRSLSNTKEKVSQAFSNVAKTLFSSKKKYGNDNFEQAMAQFQSNQPRLIQNAPPQPPPKTPELPAPKKTSKKKHPRERTESSDATSSVADSETGNLV